MFQRLKGAIDNRIAEEQARQRQALTAQQGRTPPRRRPQNPNAVTSRSATRARDSTPTPGERQPDPSDFVIGEDGPATPLAESSNPLAKSNDNEEQKSEPTDVQDVANVEGPPTSTEVKAPDTNGVTVQTEQPPELPVDVRAKLRKLEKLESRYAELLRAYRSAHARVQTIEPFEATLRENTPLTGISDPAALVEYLTQVKVKGDMVLEEFKRVSAEKEDYKKKFEQSEKDSTALKSEIELLKKKAAPEIEVSAADTREDSEHHEVAETKGTEADGSESVDPNAPTKSPPSSRLGSFSLFSPKFGTTKEPAKDTSEDLFSYDSEVPRLEQELQERIAEVESLNKQVTSLKGDLAVARESTSSMVQTLETATSELNALRDEKDKFESLKAELETRISELETKADIDHSQVAFYQTQIISLQKQRDEAASKIEMLEEEAQVLLKQKSDLNSRLDDALEDVDHLSEKVDQREKTIGELENSLTEAKLVGAQQAKTAESDQLSDKKLVTMQGIMSTLRTQLSSAEATVAELKEEIQSKQDEFARKPSSKVFGFLDTRQDPGLEALKSEEDVVSYLAQNYGLKRGSITKPAETNTPTTSMSTQEAANTTGGAKKKNKKKKKGAKGAASVPEEADTELPVKVSEDLNELESETPPPASLAETTSSALVQEVAELKKEIEDRTARIERLSQQLKDQEALREEIETLRDDLLHQGEEHVEARDKLKEVQEARKMLQERVDHIEKELADAKNQVTLGEKAEKAHKELSTQFEELKTKSESLQKDLSSTESLAASRFKDISDLKELLSKTQPEVRQLRVEVAELKSAKDDLKNKEGELKRLESRHEDLKSEMKGLGKRLGDKDLEIKELQTKIEQETKQRNKVENDLNSAQLDARVAENKRKDTSELLEQRQKELAQSKEEAMSLRRKVADLEDNVNKHNGDIASLKEEVSLKTALHSSSQSVLQSLRDQTHELSMQARESSSRAESLEEELSETQRMLSERTREGQKMKTLLDQAQNGVEARIRDMKERMEAAVEERDRVEDEATVRDRRLMRDVEDARSKMRDAQRQLKTLEDERDELETKNRDWRRRREELEQQAEEAKKDVEDVKQVAKGLREALDESERQIRDVESQKADLRRQADETNERVTKLTKANQNLSEEIKKLQEAGPRRANLRPAGADNTPRSSRTSIDSTRSPAPPSIADSSASTVRSETPTATRTSSNVGLSQGSVDYVYLKNVLLQFMEQKDKSHQRQLVPVLGMLLHFDRKDEQKWMAAISAK